MANLNLANAATSVTSVTSGTSGTSLFAVNPVTSLTSTSSVISASDIVSNIASNINTPLANYKTNLQPSDAKKDAKEGTDAIESLVKVKKYYFYDKESVLTFDEIEKTKVNDFKPFEFDISEGLKKGTMWIRLELSALPANLSEAQKREVLREIFPLTLKVGNYSLEQIRVYQKIGENWSTELRGYQFINHSSECLDDLHCFTLQTNLSGPEVVYLSVSTKNFLNVHLEVVPRAKLTSSIVKRVIRNSSAVSIGIGLLLLTCAFYAIESSPTLILFALFELSIILYFGIIVNHLEVTVNIPFTNQRFPLIQLLSHVRTLLFGLLCFFSIRNYAKNPHYLALNKGLLLLCFLNLCITVVGMVGVSLIINLLLQAAIVCLNTYGAISVVGLPKRIRNTVLFGYATYAVTYSMTVLNIFGYTSSLDNWFVFRDLYDFRLNGVPVGLFIFMVVILEILDNKSKNEKILADAVLDKSRVLILNEKLEEKGALIDLLAHEIKNPLTTIGFSSAALQMALDNDHSLRDRVVTIKKSVTRINDVIDQIYLSYQLDKSSKVDASEQINMSELINLILDGYDLASRFSIHIPRDLTLRSNRFLLMTIVGNLIGNALKYSSANSLIEVSSFIVKPLQKDTSETKNTEIGGGIFTFKVVNLVEPNNLPDPDRLFTRYYRHSNNTTIPGMGIGLSIVRTAADLIGGVVKHSIVDQHISFTFEMPIHDI